MTKPIQFRLLQMHNNVTEGTSDYVLFEKNGTTYTCIPNVYYLLKRIGRLGIIDTFSERYFSDYYYIVLTKNIEECYEKEITTLLPYIEFLEKEELEKNAYYFGYYLEMYLYLLRKGKSLLEIIETSVSFPYDEMEKEHYKQVMRPFIKKVIVKDFGDFEEHELSLLFSKKLAYLFS